MLENRGSRQNRGSTIELDDVGASFHNGMERIVTQSSDNESRQDHPPTTPNQNNKEGGVFKSYIPWIYRFSVIIENSGSIARDNLANERTFLAWVRTGSIFCTLGVTFVQFCHLESKSNSVVVNGKQYSLEHISNSNDKLMLTFGKPVEVICLLLGMVCVIFGGWRYFHVQALLTRNYFPATRVTVMFLMVVNITMLILLVIFDVKLVSS